MRFKKSYKDVQRKLLQESVQYVTIIPLGSEFDKQICTIMYNTIYNTCTIEKIMLNIHMNALRNHEKRITRLVLRTDVRQKHC